MFKKILSLCAVVLLGITGAQAKNLQGVKIYINPGHGGYYNGANTDDGTLKNDRNVPTIPFDALDENGFWESKCNLVKGLELKRLLEADGATVMISRTQNREEDDKDLKVIGEEANAFGADMFISIHSNALGSNPGTNYLLHLYNADADHLGKEQSIIDLCKKMATESAAYTYDNNITVWSPAAPKIWEDNAFLGYTLGVLRHLFVPGFLVEGSFHDYEPETHRLLNDDYAKLTANMLHRYVCDYFGADKPATGIIAGAVKDSQRVMTDPRFNNYVKKTHDRLQPINGATVTLLNAANQPLKTYTTDEFYNGVFVFKDLTPGSYTVKMEAPGYEPQEQVVEVKAAETNSFYTLLEDPNYIPPATIQGFPNIFASGLKATQTDPSKYSIDFVLNADATNVILKVFDGVEVVKTVEYGAKTKGNNTVALDLSGIVGSNLSWSIEAMAAPTTAEQPLKFTDSEKQEMTYKAACGIIFDNNQESKYFGRVYVSEAEGAAELNTTKGIYIYDAAFGDVTAQGRAAYDGNAGFLAGNYVSPFRLAVDEDGYVYITDWSDAHTGIWRMDPANPKADFKPVFALGTRAANGLNTVGGVPVHGSISHCYVMGKGEDKVLYSFDEDYAAAPMVNPMGILQYNIGNLETPWAAAPSAVAFDNADKLQLNGNSKIMPDGRGGWWISQYRFSDGAAVPSLIHTTAAGVVDYNSAGAMGTSQEGGMAVNADGTLLAMACGDEIKVFEITYADKPALNQVYTITPCLDGPRTFDIAFDAADNVYAATRDMGIGGWALPKDNNSFETKAPATMNLSSAGVDGIKVENVNIEITDNILRVEADSNLYTLTVYNAAGATVVYKTGVGMSAVVDMTEFADGVYVVKTADVVKKIVK